MSQIGLQVVQLFLSFTFPNEPIPARANEPTTRIHGHLQSKHSLGASLTVWAAVVLCARASHSCFQKISHWCFVAMESPHMLLSREEDTKALINNQIKHLIIFQIFLPVMSITKEHCFSNSCSIIPGNAFKVSLRQGYPRQLKQLVHLWILFVLYSSRNVLR